VTFARPCARRGVKIASGTFCPKCKPPAPPQPEDARPAYRAHYTSSEYRVNRKIRFRLAHGCCEICGMPLAGYGAKGVRWEAHHVRALSQGGDDSVENLRCLCLSCHKPVTRANRRAR
jgi:hypothetical protein